jgi:hypothetical protein
MLAIDEAAAAPRAAEERLRDLVGKAVSASPGDRRRRSVTAIVVALAGLGALLAVDIALTLHTASWARQAAEREVGCSIAPNIAELTD